MTDYITTPGPYMVRETSSNIPNHLTIAQANTGEIIAVVPPNGPRPHWANAALLSAAPHMLETLIEIQNVIMKSKDVINLEEINGMISQVFEKINAEVG